MKGIATYIRGLRLPFLTASVLPYLAGSFLMEWPLFKLWPFLLGLLSVVTTHLGANLLNDYADAKSGVDAKDLTFYGLFGGSKLIQEDILSPAFYLHSSLVFFGIAFISIVGLLFFMDNSFALFALAMFMLIVSLAVSYSIEPLRFCYHRWGEVIIFILFGLAPVMGGYFIQAKLFPTLDGFLLALPFGFFTTAVLFANEVPDFPQDTEGRKFTWVSLTGARRAFILYGVLMGLGFASIVLAVFKGPLSLFSLLTLGLVFPAYQALLILKNDYGDKERLLKSSGLTILIQALAGIILVLDIVF